MREVTAVIVHPTSVEISFRDRDQVRSIGASPVILVASVEVGRDSPSFGADIADALAAITDLLDDVMDEHSRAEVYEADDPTEEEEDLGMGSG